MVIVDDDSKENYFNLLYNISGWIDVNLMGMTEFNCLVEHGDCYYFAGDIVVLYSLQEENVYRKQKRLRKSLATGEVRMLHIFKEDIYCAEVGRPISSIVDGPVLEEYLIERM